MDSFKKIEEETELAVVEVLKKLRKDIKMSQEDFFTLLTASLLDEEVLEK